MSIPNISPHLKTIERICLKQFSYTEEGHACYVYVLDKLNEDNQRRIRQFKGKSSFKTYIVAVAKRLAIDFYRSRYGRNNIRPITEIWIDDIPEPQDEGISPDQAVYQLESIRLKKNAFQVIQSNLQQLSDEDRMILKLRFHSDQKISQIARVLALNQRNLYHRIGKILNRFKDAIKNEGFTDEEIKIALES